MHIVSSHTGGGRVVMKELLKKPAKGTQRQASGERAGPNSLARETRRGGVTAQLPKVVGNQLAARFAERRPSHPMERKGASRDPISSLTGTCTECGAKSPTRRGAVRSEKGPPPPPTSCLGCSTQRAQRKLIVGSSAARLEIEADRIADEFRDSDARHRIGLTTRARRTSASPNSARPRDGEPAPASVGLVVSSPGQPLESGLRASMEQHLGYDLGRVRVHTGGAAGDSARDIGARAYTVGRDVVFGDAAYQPDSIEGRRLIAHELVHVVQQTGGGARSADPWVQREVEWGGISRSSDVLKKVHELARDSFSGEFIADGRVANLELLARSLKHFDPGAPGAASSTNAFVYTCRCGWIDMGHFFANAVLAYLAAAAEHVGLTVNKRPLNEWLSIGLDSAVPDLEALIDTVPGDQGKGMTAHVHELLDSGTPRETALALGYAMEFFQQFVKLNADRQKKPWPAAVSEQRSAFTIEDLSSDRYGADMGQQVWDSLNRRPNNWRGSPLPKLLAEFFEDCVAKYPEGVTRCAMMEETTPGSCKVVNGTLRRSEGIPAQDMNGDEPNLLSSAAKLCPDATPMPHKAAPGGSPRPPPVSAVNIDTARRTLTVHGPGDALFYAKLNSFLTATVLAESPILNTEPTHLRAKVRVSPARRSLGADIRLRSPAAAAFRRLDLGAATFRGLDLAATVHIEVNLKQLFDGLTDAEVESLRKALGLEDFSSSLLAKVVNGELSLDEFAEQARILLKRDGKATDLIAEVVQLLKKRLPLATSLYGTGGVYWGPLPVSGLLFHKSIGRRPLLLVEYGLIGSELRSNTGARVGPGQEQFTDSPRVAIGVKTTMHGGDEGQLQVQGAYQPTEQRWAAEVKFELPGKKGKFGIGASWEHGGKYLVEASVRLGF